MEQYIKVLKSYFKMTSDLQNYLHEKVKPISFSNGTIIQEPGKPLKHIYFIEKGIVRMYNGGSTLLFRKENDFIISYFSDAPDFAFVPPGVEALEDVTAWDFTAEIIDSACDRFPEFNAHLRIMMQKYIVATTQVNEFLRDGDGAGLYDHLRKETPDVLDRVSSVHLASFLGVPEQVFLHMKNSNIRTPLSLKRPRRKRS